MKKYFHNIHFNNTRKSLIGILMKILSQYPFVAIVLFTCQHTPALGCQWDLLSRPRLACRLAPLPAPLPGQRPAMSLVLPTL